MSFFVFTWRNLFFKQEKLCSCCNRNFSVPSIQYWAFKYAFHLDNTIDAESECNGEKFEWEKPKPGIFYPPVNTLGCSSGSAGKEFACNAGDLGSISGLGWSPGEGNGYPLQYSGLENSMDFIVHGVTKSPTWLSDFHFHFKIWKDIQYLNNIRDASGVWGGYWGDSIN